MNDKLFNATVREVAALIRDLKRDRNYRPYIADKGDAEYGPGMCLTIGVDPDGSWSWQSGDNSFTGGAYGFACWGVGYVTPRCASRELATDLVGQAVEQMECEIEEEVRS